MSEVKSTTGTEVTSKSRPVRCVVTSDKMNKSRVAIVERLVKHERYGKYIRRRSKLMFHDENNTTHVGDEVFVRQTRPLSANKKFILVEVIRAARR